MKPNGMGIWLVRPSKTFNQSNNLTWRINRVMRFYLTNYEQNRNI